MVCQESTDSHTVKARSYLTDNSINTHPDVEEVSSESTDPLPEETESYLENEAHLVNICISCSTHPNVKKMNVCQESSTNQHPDSVILPENHIRLEK